MILPTYVAHAGWSEGTHTGQVALALRQGEDAYSVVSLAPLTQGALAQGHLREALHAGGLGHGQVLAGLDIPIGLPRSYANRTGISSFRGFLPEMGRGEWEKFHEPAATIDDVGLQRPFFRAGPGGASEQRFLDALGMTRQELCRRCEGHDAAVMFWMGGGTEAGGAALTGWSSLAASEAQSFRLWPFDGSLASLLDGDHTRVVVSETHARDFHRYLDVEPATTAPGGTRRGADRSEMAGRLLGWASTLGVTWAPEVRQRVDMGFSAGSPGDVELDAVVGLLGMLGVVTGALPSGDPINDPAVLGVEGWILGKEPLPEDVA